MRDGGGGILKGIREGRDGRKQGDGRQGDERGVAPSRNAAATAPPRHEGCIAARFPHDEIEARKGGMARSAEQRQWYLSPTDTGRLGKCQYMFKFPFTGAEPPLPS